MRGREFLWLGLVAVLVVLQAAPGGKEGDASYASYKTFVAVLQQVKRNYVTEVDDETLFYGAYKGMLAELDPYSQFMTRAEAKQLEVDTEGRFGGLGIEITLDRNRLLTVITPLEGTPAMQAGVLPGDRIIKIEGKSTHNITLFKAVQKLRGRPGSKVKITVLHQLTGKQETITITRDIIKVHSVRVARIIDEDAKIGYIRLNNFQRSTAGEVDQAVKRLLDQGMRALVLDLRRNAGGLLDSAAAVADLFIPKGVLVTTRGRKREAEHRFEAHKRGTHVDFPLAVLVSGFTASGSEIVAGAIQDHHRGILVGMRTFGKGSVQSIFPLDGGAKLRLTTAKYYTPSGRCIHRDIDAKKEDPWGIRPDIEVRTTYEDELALTKHFRQERVVEKVRDEEPPKPKKPAPAEEDEEGEKKKKFVDRALVRAIDALKAVLVYQQR